MYYVRVGGIEMSGIHCDKSLFGPRHISTNNYKYN